MTSVAAVHKYVNNPPYYGRSHPRDCARVKELCGPTRKFDFERKLWATRCTDALRELVASKKWQPVGIDREANASLMRAAAEHRAKAEAAWQAAEQARKAREEEARKRKAAEEALKLAKKREREEQAALEEAKAKRQKREAAAKAVAKLPFASKPAPAPAAVATPLPKKQRAGGIEPSEAEVAECARLGFTEQAIAWSRGLDELGPRGSLSDEGRVLRYCLLTCDADESVRELSREERRRSWGGSEVRWTLPETTSRAYAKTLEQEAATHA